MGSNPNPYAYTARAKANGAPFRRREPERAPLAIYTQKRSIEMTKKMFCKWYTITLFDTVKKTKVIVAHVISPGLAELTKQAYEKIYTINQIVEIERGKK
jgi:hypothetical protein